MPCKDGREQQWEEEDRADRAKLKANYIFLEAALCATLKALEEILAPSKINPMDVISFEEAGILEEDLIRWKTEHDAADARRKAEEK